ncbi:MAG TPA: hypothetical protein VNP94_10355 [Actinomycetota bacterium]|nr:hypothetical protein [Actinomycetota bacterium]
MASLPATLLEPGAVVPDVRFVDPAGREVSLWDFRQRRAVVLAFLHDGCGACGRFARELAAAEPEIGWAGGVVRAVTDGRPEPSLPALLDPGGGARRRLLATEEPAVLVIDRYGAAWASWEAPGHAFPEPAEIAASVRHEAFQCPECGVSTWE